jgi:aminoglycoside phosphotransferase (APT) family kinase protein
MVATGLPPRTTDDALPAAVHLTGSDARAVIETAVRAAGGGLHACRPSHVQYRPGSDLVVRYEAQVSWGDRPPVHETLLAATTRHGPPPGTLPVVADADGRTLEVGVWRWPFDPRLAALADLVTADSAAARLAELVEPPLSLEVVAYRPTERCVVRVTGSCGTTIYVKVVDPAAATALVERHRRLRAAGLPVPEIIGGDIDAGWVAMAELRGDTLRLRLKAHQPGWPAAEEYLELVDRLRGVALADVTPVTPRTVDALGHAAMLAVVLPEQQPRLERLRLGLADAAASAAGRVGPTVHGDLYEAQVIVDGGRITGLLDIDDAGAGDPVDDLATVLGHLRYRQQTITERRHRDAVRGYADGLRRGFVRSGGVDAATLDAVTAGVLVGLATGPFRIQQHNWRHEVRRTLRRAERLLAGGPVPDR